MSDINEAFKPLWYSKDRYFLLTGGRGGLKSSTVHDYIAKLTYERGHGILFTRYLMTSAEFSIIPEFQLTLDRLGVSDHFKVTKNVIINKHTGSFIYFSGIRTNMGNQTGRLKSIVGITTWVIEEGEDFKDEKTFETIDDSIRTKGKQNRIIWIQNPTDRHHFIYKKFIEPKNKRVNIDGYDVTMSDMENVTHIHTTYKIAEHFLNESWLRKAEKHRLAAERAEAEKKGAKYKSHYYFNYIGGWLEEIEGAVFPLWSEGEFDKSVPYCYGLDLGYYPDPTVLVKVGLDKKRMKMYLSEKIYATQIDNDILADVLKENIDRRRDLIVADTNEPRTLKMLLRNGLNIQKAKKGSGSIAQDIRDMKQYEIIVDPKSQNLKRELKTYVWNDKRASIPIGDNNHCPDASRYGFRRLESGRRSGVRRRN